VRERWYGETFENPAPRLAEYADLVREVLSPRDGPLKFEGRFYNIELPAYEGSPNDRANPVKVFGSGLNPTMLKTMSRRMDGLALHPLVIQPGYFTDVAAPALESGVDLRADGRPELAAWLLISVGRDAEAARAAARRQLAFYLSTPSYRAVAEASGWGDVVERLREQFKTVGAKWDELGRLLPQELVDGLCPSGMPDEVSEGIARIAAFLEPHRVTELVLEPCGVGVTDEEALQGFQYLVDRATD
jgi:alkanesulfonate monooxygenase SsuD/methylene tetrahydromethanopterin reductase-like flavin-dependent oxidoreductase (luciferase family)